jgi:hypothetical protein
VLPPALALTLPLAALRAGWASRAARAGIAAYLAVLVGIAASRFRTAARDACWLPVVLATMHLSWGCGFLVGAARFGPPLRAIAMLARPRMRRHGG